MKKRICALFVALLLCVFCADMAARAEEPRADAPGAEMTAVGRTLSFAGTDPDGNAVNGEALFGDNEITLLNLWRAWYTECADALESLLAGASVPKAEAGGTGSPVYRVFVKDKDGNPVEEAAVQLCDDRTCRLGETDADGCAVFEVSRAGAYEVHVLDAPEGYAYDEDEVYRLDEASPDATIVLKKDE